MDYLMDYLLLAVLFVGAIAWCLWAHLRSGHRAVRAHEASGVPDAKETGPPRP